MKALEIELKDKEIKSRDLEIEEKNTEIASKVQELEYAKKEIGDLHFHSELLFIERENAQARV